MHGNLVVLKEIYKKIIIKLLSCIYQFPTDNSIEFEGMMYLSESLKWNYSIQTLNLEGKQNKKIKIKIKKYKK